MEQNLPVEEVKKKLSAKQWGLIIVGGSVALLSYIGWLGGKVNEANVAGVSAEASVAPSFAPIIAPTPEPTIEATPTPSFPAESVVSQNELKATPKPTVKATPKPTVAPKPSPETISGGNTGGGDKDCGDFKNHAEAQAYFVSKGGSASNNVDRLDRDRDGLACEDN